MSDPPKAPPTFSFGQPSTNNTSSTSNVFGSNAGQSNNSKGNIFGSSTGQNNVPKSSIFGSSSQTPQTSSSGLFGNSGSTLGPTPPTFSSATNTGQSSSLFGSKPSSNGNPSAASATSKPNPFSGFSTPAKPSDGSTPGQKQAPSLFGGGNTTGSSNPFGNLGSNTTSSSQSGLATPATSKPGGLFSFGNVSTTPAGPPPASNTGAGAGSGSLFGSNMSQEQKSSPFGASTGGQSLAPTASSSSAPANPFGSLNKTAPSSLFGAKQAPESSITSGANQASQQPSGNTPSTPQTSIFGSGNTTTQPSGSLFGNSNKQQSSSFSQPQGDSSKPPSLFSNLGSQGGAATPTTQSSSGLSFGKPAQATVPTGGGTKPTFTFPSSSAPQVSTPATTSSSGPSTSSLFGALGGQTTSSETPASSAPASAPPLFPSINNKIPGTAPPGSLFPSRYESSEKPPVSTPNLPTTTTSAATAPSGADEAAKAGATLGASTTGPRPPAQSRLKNKSMDEIITRWATDLSKYQKEFQKQAQKVANWDRMLVENSDRIQKLYGSTLEAERATVEVERQLTTVENDQAELEYWLEYYEKQVDDMMSSTQVGQSDGLVGPDQERERTYKLAEKLSDRLDEMGKDLTSMIEEINDASSNLSKNSKSDDPLSQIVRVLNGHLSQLQQIDQGAAALQAKVTAAQKASRSIRPANGTNGLGGDAVDDFYRSYMGRR